MPDLPCVAFVVNGEASSAMGHRAQALAAHLHDQFAIRLFYRSPRKIRAMAQFAFHLIRFRPHICYVFDMAFAGVLAGAFYRKLLGGRLIIDTGDAIAELAKAMDRSPLGQRLTRWLESFSLAVADHIVVRGTFHQRWLSERGIASTLLRDGVETELFHPGPEEELRRQLGLEGVLTVGLVGSSVFSKKTGTCYGWDLVELIRLLEDRPVHGVMIGGGSGIPILQERCRDYGILNRMHFVGYTPYQTLPQYLRVIDVCLSTQSNDLIGQVRTTGKLPLYLATGRFILASRVGEAALVLPQEMLVDYQGAVDLKYPERLAERVLELLAEPARLQQGRTLVEVARREFDYAVLAAVLRQVLKNSQKAC